jgi:hypothetical protein
MYSIRKLHLAARAAPVIAPAMEKCRTVCRAVRCQSEIVAAPLSQENV